MRLWWIDGCLWFDDSESKKEPHYYIWDLMEERRRRVYIEIEPEISVTRPVANQEFSTSKSEGIYSKHDFSDSWIYFIEGANKVKIGRSQDPEGRLETLQTGSPVPLVLFARMRGGPATERRLHEMFSNSLSHGEWYYLTDRLKDYIRAYAEILENELLIDGIFVSL